MELFTANSQWSNRPADERFETLQDMYVQTRKYYESARETERPVSELRVEAIDKDIALVGKMNHPAKLTNWASDHPPPRFTAQPSYLRPPPATLAANNLNHGLSRLALKGDSDSSPRAKMLFHMNGSL